MKTVLITGAGGNLGTAVTEKFLASGYSVIATASNDAAKKDIPSNENLHVATVDLTNEDLTSTFIEDIISRYKKIDAALMLVGGFAMGNIDATTGTNIRKQFSLNFETAYFAGRPLFRHMMEQKSGRIVFIGARPALQPADGKNMIAYALSKSLLFKLAEFLNAEAKGTDVSATVIVPSTLDTELNRKSMPEADPGKWVKTGELADLLEFVVSEKASVLRETVLKVYNNA